MIILNSTRSLEVKLDATPSAEFQWTASYLDLDTGLAAPSDGVTNGSTAVTMIAAPSPGPRQVKTLAITNLSNASRVVSVQINNGTATRFVNQPTTLPSGYCLHYNDVQDFFVEDSTGSKLTGMIGATGIQGIQGLQGLQGGRGATGPASWNAGTATIDFGAFPGSSEASVTITGLTGLTSGAQAYFGADTSSSHTVSDHQYAAQLIGLSVSSITAGVGFTIYARCLDKMQGTFTVRYVWA